MIDKKRVIPMPKRRMVGRPTKPAPEAPPDLTATTSVFLTIRHSINGFRFGPGQCDVPNHLVSMVLENEQRNLAEERGLTQRRAAMIGPGGRKTRVDPAMFDDPNGMFSQPAQFAVQGGDR